jgi:5-(carboxyamino)imidazole ribonucleotide synthase
VVTIETENIPFATLEFLATLKPVRPSPTVLRIAQDRLREKDYLRSIDVATAQYREVTGPTALTRAVRDLGHLAVLKTVRMGYDGKGQVMLGPDTDLKKAWAAMGGEIGILEGFVDYACEISVVVARSLNGAIATYPPVENQHANHILETTIVPARISPETAMRAEAIARHIAEKLDLVGILAVEMFVTQGNSAKTGSGQASGNPGRGNQGGGNPDGELLVNELAPRPHNSGHWTIDACVTSQFEQLIRAICGLPLGSTERHSDAVMRNLIGGDVEKWRETLNDPSLKLHLYGKLDAPPGRKMGHVTRLIPRR